MLADAAKHDASKASYTLQAGFNLLADLDIKGSKGMGSLMASGGVSETVIPIVGTVSASTFKHGAAKVEQLKNLDLSVALPDLKIPGLPSTITVTKPVFAITETAPAALKQSKDAAKLMGPFVTIGADLVMQASGKSHEFDALLMVGKDAKNKRVINLEGSAKDPKGLFAFKGLSVKTLELASVFEGKAWDFRFDGTADLNGAELDFNTEIQKAGGKVTYVATLTAPKGITAKDVAGRDVPGFDKVALDKVTVTGDRLVAELEFGAKKIPGEIAAFHPAGADKAVMAVTLDKLAFGDLLPGAAGSALDGVSVDELTMVIVPAKNAGLKPDDPAVPDHIAINLGKILADVAKRQTKKTDFALKEGINMLAALDLSGAKEMNHLMSFIGYDASAGIPIIGVVSRHLFDNKGKMADRIRDTDLAVPMPNLSLADLPGAFSLSNSELKITDKGPNGTTGLWVGLISDMSADLMGHKIAFTSDVGFKKGDIALEAKSDSHLPAPFGISWLALKDLDVTLAYNKRTKTSELLFKAVPTEPFGEKTPQITIELKEVKGKLTAGVLKIQETVAFSDLPILKGVPHADQFDFTFLEISKTGVSGGSLLHGEKVDVVLFEHNKKWTFALSDNGGGSGFKFGRIMPPIRHTSLANFHLNDAAVIFSQSDITGKVSDLPEVAHQVFADIYGNANATVNVKNGITLAANFSPGKSSGFAANGLKGIGVHDDILIEGTIENIFSGSGAPGVDIMVDIEQGPGGKKGASHSPKMIKFPGQVGFFIQYKADELDVGLAADVVLAVPKNQKLDLVTKMELELNEKGFAVDIFLDLKGKWDKPFGIPGVDLEEVAIKFGIDMEGEATFGFRGKAELADGAERIDIAAEMDFELEAAGLPDGIALKGNVSELGIPAMIDIAERMAGGKKNLIPPGDIPLPEFKDVTFAFATPGVSDPQLGLVGSGFKLAGNVYFLNKELGKADIEAGITGIKMDASIDPIDLKVLELDKNQMKFDLSFEALPKLEIDSEIEFLGAKQTVLVKFDKGMVDIEFDEKIGGGIWESSFNLGYGVDAAYGGAPDIFVEGEVKSDFFAWLRDKAPEKVHHFFEILNKDFEEAKAGINKAEAVVRSWDKKIQARKEVVQREKANADAALHRAEAKVESVARDANYAKGKARYHDHHCHWYSAWHCAEAGYYWARYGVERVAYDVAEGVLHAAQETVDHMPSELMDPQLTALEGERDIAMTALEIAKAAINGVESADKWMEKGLDELLKKIGDSNALVIKEIFFEGDMDAMIKGSPFILTMDLEVFGDDLGTQMFAFKLTDPLYDAEQLAFIPLQMVSSLFKNHLPSSLRKLLGPVLAAIDKESKKSLKKVHDELKNLPGVKLPAEVKKALQSAGLDEPHFTRHADAGRWLPLKMHAPQGPLWWQNRLKKRIVAQQLAMLLNNGTGIMSDAPSPLFTLAQATTSVKTTPVSASAKGKTPVEQRMAAYKEKMRNLLQHMLERNKAFGENYMEFANAQEAERKKQADDFFVAHTDIRVPPGTQFNEKLLVARHSKLCLGQNGQGKITFHPCNVATGGLLWATKRKLVNLKGQVIPWNDTFALEFPNRVYTQLVHDGACLTTPFHMAATGRAAQLAHKAKLREIASKPPANVAAHLTLSGCSTDGRGQLWKAVKVTHNPREKLHGFKLQERDSAYCLRPETVKAHTNKKSKEVKAVFYPCSGVAHATFEMVVPNNELPIWYDHNGVIKSANGYCLDVPNDLAADADKGGSVVFLSACADDQFDRWDYVVEYDKTVKIVNDFTGHCLYPYDAAEGKIPDAVTGQLVQRPCDGRYGQGWKMRTIPKQKWFQLEALDKSKKPTKTCMIPAIAAPKASDKKVKIFVKACDPATRGRWQFGHWKGTYAWTEWTSSTSISSDNTNLSEVYWISKDDLKNKAKNGVCRVIYGNRDTGHGLGMFLGTWHGDQRNCHYEADGQMHRIDPSDPGGLNIHVEVLSGLDIGVPGATASWKPSSSGIPFDTTGQNKVPPAPTFTPFLAGGSSTWPLAYLCRVRDVANTGWYYGYQTMKRTRLVRSWWSQRQLVEGGICRTEVGRNTTGPSQVLVFATVKNQDTGN